MLPDQIERLTRRLRKDMVAVWAQILAEQTALAHEWWHLTPPVRHRRLNNFERTTRALINRADEIAAQHILGTIEGAYEIGLWNTALWAKVPPTSVVLDMVDFDTITHLAGETMDDLLAATNHIDSQAKKVVRDMSRDSIRSKIYTGKTAEQAGIELATNLRETGVTGVTYRNGARFPLDAYSEMVVRTKTAEAYQHGGFNQGERLDIEFWEVFDGHDCGWASHDDPQKANGLIVHLNQARAYPIAHPNCLRSTSPRPDIQSWADIEHAERSTTAAQRAMQARAEQERERARLERPRYVGLRSRSRALQARRDAVIRARDGIMSPAELRHKARVEKRRLGA